MFENRRDERDWVFDDERVGTAESTSIGTQRRYVDCGPHHFDF